MIVFALLTGSARAQTGFWIIPENKDELAGIMGFLKAKRIHIRVESRWLNAVSVDLSRKQRKELLTAPCAFRMEPVLRLKECSVSATGKILYEKALEQMQAGLFVRHGIAGMGVKVGVTDAGFLFLNDTSKASDLNHLWKGNQFAGMKDFVRKLDTLSYEETFYTGRKKPLKKHKNWFLKMIRDIRLIYHFHGTEVLRMIAGYEAVTDYHYGLATESSFYLARTEDGRKEYKEEEDYYVAALEWMEEHGVRIVNTSLGYGRGRKLKGENYKPADMNGSSMIAKAVNIACTEKNMLVVVAAGNDGDKRRWKVINTPADAASALTVGAVLSHFEKASYSGVGPEFNSYLKPEVSAFSVQGTSLSAPAVCGFAACLLEMNDTLSAAALKQIIIKSSHLYPFGNNYIGYGVPLASRAIQILRDPKIEFNNVQEIISRSKTYQLQVSDREIPYVTVFHKKDLTHVLFQELLTLQKDKNYITVQRPEGCVQSTVQAGYEIREIIWEGN